MPRSILLCKRRYRKPKDPHHPTRAPLRWRTHVQTAPPRRTHRVQPTPFCLLRARCTRAAIGLAKTFLVLLAMPLLGRPALASTPPFVALSTGGAGDVATQLYDHLAPQLCDPNERHGSCIPSAFLCEALLVFLRFWTSFLLRTPLSDVRRVGFSTSFESLSLYWAALYRNLTFSWQTYTDSTLGQADDAARDRVDVHLVKRRTRR